MLLNSYLKFYAQLQKESYLESQINNFKYLLRRFNGNMTSGKILVLEKFLTAFLYFSLEVAADVLRMLSTSLAEVSPGQLGHPLLIMIDGSQENSSVSRGHLDSWLSKAILATGKHLLLML